MLDQTVVHEQAPGVSVHVGPRILGLAVLLEDLRHQIEQHTHDGEVLVVGGVFLRELLLRDVTRIGGAQHSVAVAGDDLPAVQRVPEELGQLLPGRHAAAQLFLHTENPAHDLLAGQSVQRPSEAVDSRGQAQVRVAQRGADEVGRMRADVAPLVIGQDGQVQTHQLPELGFLDAQQVGQVGRPVQAGLRGRDVVALLVVAPVDVGRHQRQPAQQQDGVIEHRLPVVGLG